ncbi:MAG: hypothetical protein WCA77_02945 [Thermoplasmata archaeon]
MPYREEYPVRRIQRGDLDDPAPVARSSNAAIPVAIVVLVLGLYLGTLTVLAPALLGLLCLFVSVSFLSARLNPFSIGFYLTTKPSWASIGVLVLTGLALIGTAYLYWKNGIGPILPRTLVVGT